MMRRLFGSFGPVLVGFLGSCTSSPQVGAPLVEPPNAATDAPPSKLVELGRWVVGFDATSGALTVAPESETGSALTPQGPLGALSTAQLQITQLGAVYVNSATSKTYAGKGGANANTCTLGAGATYSVCASTVLQAITPTGYNDVWIELTVLTPGVTARTNQYSTAMPWETSTLATSPKIAWRYGTVQPGTSLASPGPQSSESDWVFDSTISGNLNFNVHAVGIRSYPSYTTAATWTKPDLAGFQNACNPTYPPADAPPLAGGVQQIGSGAKSTFGTVLSPFPISIYDQTSEEVWFTTSGVVGVGAIPTIDHPTSRALPGPATTNFLNAVYAFWSGLQTGSTYQAGGVCTALTGSAPNRALVVTWADMSFTTDPTSPASDLFFSVVFNEGSDLITVQHYYPLGGDDSYLFGSASYLLGGKTVSATTIGVQGNATTATQYGAAGVVSSPNTQFTDDVTGANILLKYSRRDVTTITFAPN
ncbi:MAG: hypothetical protein ACHREM_17820 [Polyangiales bacterium]